ncbi:hypothetical protein [Mesobacillus boroniphilus]|uniref:Uncharacterized protein n=1 Tax=Mesobacillus boroniphilus JCM 21738 TaxID=1294265 RepID=W4RLH6_9BACI|nr:hypothetical protein [Mesobacillus boroniphilus]GAE44967.1 hypothetical protein JCM21738_1727 [Mesobacillus boroniphilus JCM 21738]
MNFQFPVSPETKQVIEVSIGYMNSYKQVYLNEGHVLKSIPEKAKYVHGEKQPR